MSADAFAAGMMHPEIVTDDTRLGEQHELWAKLAREMR
jgi:hypothetical protein